MSWCTDLFQGYFTNYPKHVLLVLVNEFCERFSYYGMKGKYILITGRKFCLISDVGLK